MPSRLRLAGLCALILASAPARAADFGGPYPPPDDGPPAHAEAYGPDRPPPPPPGPDFRRPRFAAGETCREFVRRRLDPDGEPVLRRVRICDEPGFERGPPPPPPPPEEIPPRRWGPPRW